MNGIKSWLLMTKCTSMYEIKPSILNTFYTTHTLDLSYFECKLWNKNSDRTTCN